MTEKRFKYEFIEDDEYYEIIDKEQRYSFNFIKDEWLATQVCDCLNEQQKIINELGETNEILLDNLNKELNRNHQSSQSFINERIKDKDEIIEDYRAEDKRLNDVIINLHKELRQNEKKIKMQDHIIDTQQDIINAFCELVGMINDKGD